jgi:hypothetical protein
MYCNVIPVKLGPTQAELIKVNKGLFRFSCGVELQFSISAFREESGVRRCVTRNKTLEGI